MVTVEQQTALEEPVQIERLGLTKLYLWSEADRIQTYPQALARLSEHAGMKAGATRRQIGEHLFRLAYVKGRKPLRENVLTNCFGAVRTAQDKVVIRGINLFRRREPALPVYHGDSHLPHWESQDDLWLPTDEAIALGEAYAGDRQGICWQQRLAEQLGRYEVRTRLLLHRLARGGRLIFAEGGFFAGPDRLARLAEADETLSIFAGDDGVFNRLLERHVESALGPWWQAELHSQGYKLVPSFRLEGANNGPPSTSVLSYTLRGALTVFAHLGILVEGRDGWVLDAATAARHLSPQLVTDLWGEEAPVAGTDPHEALHRAVADLADGAGYVVAAQLAERWATLMKLSGNAERQFDAFVRSALYDGSVRIAATHPGQPRMGRGLLDNDDYRRVKLIVNGRD